MSRFEWTDLNELLSSYEPQVSRKFQSKCPNNFVVVVVVAVEAAGVVVVCPLAVWRYANSPQLSVGCATRKLQRRRSEPLGVSGLAAMHCHAPPCRPAGGAAAAAAAAAAAVAVACCVAGLAVTT